MGILAHGLSYKIFFNDTKFIQVDSEENSGWIDCKVIDWVFYVDINILEVTGFTSQLRLNNETGQSRWQEREQKYKRLLGG